jgi:gas vesicle protein
MREKTLGGVDGHNLDSALDDEIREAGNQVIEVVQQQALDLEEDLKHLLSNVEPWVYAAPEVQSNLNVPHKRKYERLLEPVASVGGGIGGMWVSVKVGASVGAVGGPVGMAVGGIVGGLFGAWLGSAFKSKITKRRADQVETPIKREVESFVQEASRELEQQIKKSTELQRTRLDEWMSSQRTEYEFERDTRLADMDADIETRASIAASLREAVNTLRDSLRRIGGTRE